MSLRINNITLGIDENIENIKKKVLKKLNVSEKDIQNIKILKESIDARRKNNIRFNYIVEVYGNGLEKIAEKVHDRDIVIEKEEKENITFGKRKLISRPVIVGMGPAGMFAGLIMAQNGYKPIIIERGNDVDKRTSKVNEFWKSGKLDTESNVQFGEGGAGTFSDGKLTTRIKDKRCTKILDEFVKFGAPEDIIYSGKPHIGTDILKKVVKNIRQEIINLGGDVKFESKLENLIIEDGKLTGIIVNGEKFDCSVLILAIGNSSRDTYEMLYKNNIVMERKPFAIGVRVEHLQSMIDKSQYGKYAGHPRLKAADYRLTYTSKDTGRSAYSFCMCPGGNVVGAASENGRLVINGMSYHARSGENANSAIVVTVGPQDFEGSSPLSGVEFQRHYEELAYKEGGGKYHAPLELMGDFLKDDVKKRFGKVKPTYVPGYEFVDSRKCLPDYVIDTLKESFIAFDRRLKGFADSDAVLTGIETRTSAPIRIERDEKLQSISAEGLYPSGEGAGYAGGIISASVDGVKCAESIMKEYEPIVY